jgi:hypothetical protein
MAMKKNYDEMADVFQYTSESHLAVNQTGDIGKVWIWAAFVDGKSGGDTFWLVASRKGEDWFWTDHGTDFILLVDGERSVGSGELAEADYGEEVKGFFDVRDFYTEEVHCGFDPSAMNAIAKSSSAKFRLGGLDFALPTELITDVKEIVAEIAANGGYGK